MTVIEFYDMYKNVINNTKGISTDIAMDSSDVILTKNDSNSIINLSHISKKQ